MGTLVAALYHQARGGGHESEEVVRRAFGSCRCSPVTATRHSGERALCERVLARIRALRTLESGELIALPPEAHEEIVILGKSAQPSVDRVDREEGGCVVVVQGFLPTWWRPTYVSLSLGVVGRLVAEGLIVLPDGAMPDAPDEVMWAFR